MVVKILHQFYYHSKYLNSMKCQEISMGPSIRTIRCSRSLLKKDFILFLSSYAKHCSKSLLKKDFILFLSSYAKHCSKSLLKKDFILFLSSYANSFTAICMFFPLL
jgi:hypothetical protein